MNQRKRHVLAASFSVMLMVPAGFAQMAPAASRGSALGSSSVPSGANPMPGASNATFPARAPSMLDQSAAPAVINFAAGKLTIQATNSSLRTILNDLESRTGTKVEGLNRDERIFGVYGPGNPQDVLAALLDDSGYNVLISGKKADGSPREVVLSTRSVSAAAQPAQGAGRTQASDEDDENEGTAAPPVPQPALFAPPPQGVPPSGPNQPAGASQIRTPQQMLEELQRIRQGANAQGTPQNTPQSPNPQGAPPQ